MATTYSEREHLRGRDAELGREARTPREITARGWWDILKRVRAEVSRDNLSLIAAGVAFYALLAIPPALAAGIALWGLVSDPQSIQAQITQLSGALPEEAARTYNDQLRAVAARSPTTLGWTAAIGFLLSLWSARAAMNAMIGALNIVYEEREKRGFLRLTATSVLLTLGALVGGVLALLLVAGVPVALSILGASTIAQLVVNAVRWTLLLVLVMAGLAVLYRLAPSRHQPRWSWASWGAGIATLLWIGASAAFSLFVSNFGSYNETYGALAAIVVVMLWLFLVAYAVIVGAELNAELERQTAVDSTTGAPAPLGSRGAHAADTVGRATGRRFRRGARPAPS